MKNSTFLKQLSTLIIIILFFLISGKVFAENNDTLVFQELYEKLMSKKPDSCKDMGAELQKYKKMMFRDCSYPERLMNEMISYWHDYYKYESKRLEQFEFFSKREQRLLADFVLSGTPGKFYKMYEEIKNEAKNAGLLIEGTPPWLDSTRRKDIQISKSEFAFDPDAERYFYFRDDVSKYVDKWGKAQDLKEAFEKLKGEWNQAREHYKSIFEKEAKTTFDEIDQLASKMHELKKKYNENVITLVDIATGGEYEHCLGKIKPTQSVAVSIFEGLYYRGEPNTLHALPGMGLNFYHPAKLTKPSPAEIPDFPLPLHLKKDGTEARKYVLNILKLQKENASRKSIETGNKVADTILSFSFDTTYFAIEPIAKLEYALLDFAKHPIDTPIKAGKATVKFLDEVAGIKFENWQTRIDMDKSLTKTILDGIEKSVLDAKKKLGDLGTEVALNLLESDRFEVKPNDKPNEVFRKLTEELESIQKVNDGVQVLAKATAEIGTALAGAALAKAVKPIDLSKRGLILAEIEQASLSAGAKTQKGEALLAKLNDLKARYPAAVKVDIPKEADAIKALRDKFDDTALRIQNERKLVDATKSQLDDATKARHQAIADDLAKTDKEITNKVNDLAKHNDEAQKAIQQSNADDIVKKINEPIDKPFKGAKTEVKEEFTVKSTDGSEIKIKVGEQLGKGSTTTAYINAENDAFVVKAINLRSPQNQIVSNLDDFGRNVLEKDVKSNTIRIAERKGVYKYEADPLDPFGEPKKFEIVERVQNTAEDIIFSKQGGQMTQGQKLAFEQAMRDLNNKGYAWLDNHYGNYTFEQLPGQDRWRVVVIDSGNIVKLKGANLDEMAKNARKLQQDINKIDEHPIFAEIVDFKKEFDLAKKKFLENSNIDFDAMGLKQDQRQFIGFAIKPGLRPDLKDLTNLSDDALTNMLKTKTDEAIKSIASGTDDMAEQALKKKASAGFDDKALDVDNKAIEELNKQANIRELIQKCAEFIKLRNSGYDPEKLKKMVNPCQAIGI